MLQGIGPVYAIPQVLAQAGISIKDVDVFEVSLQLTLQAASDGCVDQ